MTVWLSPSSPLFNNSERSTALYSLVTMARPAMIKREVVNDPMVYASSFASFDEGSWTGFSTGGGGGGGGRGGEMNACTSQF